MDGTVALGDEHLDPPPRLFERLGQIAGYTWNERQAFHSSYDNWQTFGTKHTTEPPQTGKGPQQPSGSSSGESSPQRTDRNAEGASKPSSDYGGEWAENRNENLLPSGIQVVARVSTHTLREERAYHICKSLTASVDPEGLHIVRPVDLVRLTSHQGGRGPMVVCIYEHPGANYLSKVVDFGPAWYRARKVGEKYKYLQEEHPPREQIPLRTFLDFAVGATECLELLHHGQRIVHGEIRGDAFHMNADTGMVKLINLGSGLRTFEHGLTSTGWSTLSTETGAMTKISYMSPEQTGRMPAEPDSRTDIYSLGILFWTMLTQQPAFDGATPMDIIQGVLGRRLPLVSSMRLDVPDVIGRIIQKMTAKTIGDRYHSVIGLRHDLVEVRRLLGTGDSNALKKWDIATKDVSSFFILPNIMIGRVQEHDEVVRIIDKVSRRHTASQKQSYSSLSSGSSLSESLLEIFVGGNAIDAASDDNTSSFEERSNSIHTIGDEYNLSGETKPIHKGSSGLLRASSLSNPTSGESWTSTTSSVAAKHWENNKSLTHDPKSMADSMKSENARSSSDGVGSVGKDRNTQKFRRVGRCEVVSIAGAAGLGKSCLVQSVQVEARRRGYFASSKFDQAKKTPFGPVLKLLSSLFKQIFSESNTETPFHQTLKQYVRPAWPMLHKVLGLPEFLLGNLTSQASIATHSKRLSQGYNKSLKSEVGRRDSSPSSSRGSLYNVALGAQSSQDFLRAGTSTKSVRLMNTVLDVLRVFTQTKFICLCLDDLQFADDESLDLISQIIISRMKLIIIVTYRPDEILPEKIRGIINFANAEDKKYIKAGGIGITKVTLEPLSEDDILEYVAATLCRDKSEVLPLAAVIQSKSAGNPFYMREMLDTCHRKQCIWYDYKENGWRYDLDRMFKHFETANYHETLNSEFVAGRLTELPPMSRSILAWASLVGTSFSFELIQRLMGGEFEYNDIAPLSDIKSPLYSPSYSEQEIIEGLQAAIQAYIIIATQEDDKFRFVHDRYIQAAAFLREGNDPKMHFIVAQTLLKYYPSDERYQDAIASHICKSISVINDHVVHRQSYRKLLFDTAQSSAESGARSTAEIYYTNCFALLQQNPWADGQPDVYYDETLQLYIRAAECYLYMGRYHEAKALLATVFSNAKTAVDKAPAWVLQSRIMAQEREPSAAFRALKHCLAALDILVDENPSFEKCDAEFQRICLKIKSSTPNELINKSIAKDSNLAAVGAVLVETISAAFWTDTLTFYHMALVMVDTQLSFGNFPQAGMAYLHLAMIAISRFNMIQFACDVGSISISLMEQWRDPYTMARGGTIYSLFVGHVQYSLKESLDQLEGALEYALQAGDRISTVLNFGLVGNLRFFASENLATVESFCTYGCEEIPNWQHDTRGGTMLIALRQTCRALQGKTSTSIPSEIMSDEQHNSPLYKAWIKTQTESYAQPLLFYEGVELAPLYLYGHYEAAVALGNACLQRIDTVWSARNTRFALFFHGLSVAAVMWTKLSDPRRSITPDNSVPTTSADCIPKGAELQEEVTGVVTLMKYCKRKIDDWKAVSDVNYFTWSNLLAAQIAEMEGYHGMALQCYEESLDHASAHSFVFEEALGNHLLAGFFLRTNSRRPAKSALREAILLFRQHGAVGVATHIETEHGLLLQGPTKNLRFSDAAAQTDFAGDSAPVQYTTLEGDDDDDRQQSRNPNTQSRGDRIGAWQSGSARNESGSGLPALDMLDLTSILESSQVISSVLQVDQLLKTMCEIILQNCGGLATLAAIVVEEDDPVGWSIAASGDQEKGAQAHIPGLPLNENALVAEGVILYCTRFRETVFLPDMVHDERFSNVTEAWAARNPLGKAVIALPICHGNKPLLGVLYLEGEPNAFTDRNLTLLQLLVNQIGISYSNALTLKQVERVSAFNNSMVDMQKRALATAIDAENKANIATAEALRNVELAEEATRAKSIFLANVSHELRTPLNGVIGNSELLKDSELRKDQAEMAESIRVSADLLLTVINDILDFSKMEADKMQLFIVAFNADEMIREVVRSVSYSNRDKRSTKDVKVLQDINLPQSLIYGDPVRLHQVLGNLIGNSLKFTENGSITVGARTDWETNDAVSLTFWVKDTGIGIPSQQLLKLFKPFSQADASTARKYGGSGLGLSICKSLVESMMGGTIRLESEEDKGTTALFSVTFDKANAEVSAGDSRLNADSSSQRSEPEPENIVASYSDFSSVPRDELRICIAEDNPINQKIAVQFLQKLSLKHVDAYDNGLLAVEGLRRMAEAGQPYHLVLMDVQMPILDGYEATKLIRKDSIEMVRKVLIIAMTASAIQGDREKCLESGMNDYLAKPVRSNVLKTKLDQYLQQEPISMPNIESHGRQIASAVLQETNESRSSPCLLGPSEPLTPTPQSIQRKSLEPQQHRPTDALREQSSLDKLSKRTTFDTKKKEQAHNHDEDVSSKNLPIRRSNNSSTRAEKQGPTASAKATISVAKKSKGGHKSPSLPN